MEQTNRNLEKVKMVKGSSSLHSYVSEGQNQWCKKINTQKMNANTGNSSANFYYISNYMCMTIIILSSVIIVYVY